MPEMNLPKLTEAQVRALASEKSFERGKNYYQGGALVEPLRRGLELRAECEGTECEPYQISVTLDAKGVAETACTCPYDWGGVCKHIVALLLACVHNPQGFRVVEPLDELLAGKSKGELILIIQDMLRHKPDLISVVELPAETQGGKPMNVSAYRTQARQAMRHESSRVVERELKVLGETAARLAKSGEVLNASAIYHALLDETVKGYVGTIFEVDEDGNIALIVDGFAKGLGECLAQSQADAETRREWLGALLRAELADIALGGIDLAPSALEAVLKYANREEWEWIEERLPRIFSTKSGWAHETIQQFLAKGRRKYGIKS